MPHRHCACKVGRAGDMTAELNELVDAGVAAVDGLVVERLGPEGAREYADGLRTTVNLGGLGIVTSAFLQKNHVGQAIAPCATLPLHERGSPPPLVALPCTPHRALHPALHSVAPPTRDRLRAGRTPTTTP